MLSCMKEGMEDGLSRRQFLRTLLAGAAAAAASELPIPEAEAGERAERVSPWQMVAREYVARMQNIFRSSSGAPAFEKFAERETDAYLERFALVWSALTARLYDKLMERSSELDAQALFFALARARSVGDAESPLGDFLTERLEKTLEDALGRGDASDDLRSAVAHYRKIAPLLDALEMEDDKTLAALKNEQALFEYRLERAVKRRAGIPLREYEPEKRETQVKTG